MKLFVEIIFSFNFPRVEIPKCAAEYIPYLDYEVQKSHFVTSFGYLFLLWCERSAPVASGWIGRSK